MAYYTVWAHFFIVFLNFRRCLNVCGCHFSTLFSFSKLFARPFPATRRSSRFVFLLSSSGFFGLCVGLSGTSLTLCSDDDLVLLFIWTGGRASPLGFDPLARARRARRAGSIGVGQETGDADGVDKYRYGRWWLVYIKALIWLLPVALASTEEMLMGQIPLFN